MTLEQNQQCI